MSWYNSLIKDSEGNIVGTLSSGEDITERKQADEALKKSEMLHREAQKIAQIGHWVLDSPTSTPIWSEEIYHIFGLDPKLSAPSFIEHKEIIHSEDWPLLDKSITQLSNEGKPFNIQFRILRSDDRIGWMHAMGNAEKNDTGSVVRMFGTAQDITTQKSIELKLKESEERYRSLFENNHVVMLLIDPESGDIIDANPAAVSFYGWTRKKMKTKKITEINTLTQKEIEKEIQAAANGKRNCFHFKHRRSDDTICDVEVYSGTILLNNRKLIYSMIYDVSERIKVQKEKQALQKRLIQSQKMESIGTLAGGIAHDFNNILTPIFGYTEFAMDHINQPEKLKEDLDEIYQAAERSRNLIKQILTFSRQSSQEKQPLKLSIIVKEVVKLLRATIPTNIEIRLEITAQKIILSNPDNIHQIIMNLCTNAYQAMQIKGGILGVTLKDVELTEADLTPELQVPIGQYVRLEIGDTGPGMEKELLAKIFEPYFTTKGIDEGTGLGLAVVHGIVKDHDGFIQVYSESGKGTTFHVYLPVVDKKPDACITKKGKASLAFGKERIMFVDDEEKILKMAREILSSYGYQVTAFSDAVQALRDFEKQPNQYDLVITDMTMPHMLGTEFFQKVMKIRPDIPVILCTGHSDQVNRDKALAMGIREYIKKPILMSNLLKIIRGVLEHEKSHAF